MRILLIPLALFVAASAGAFKVPNVATKRECRIACVEAIAQCKRNNLAYARRYWCKKVWRYGCRKGGTCFCRLPDQCNPPTTTSTTLPDLGGYE